LASQWAVQWVASRDVEKADPKAGEWVVAWVVLTVELLADSRVVAWDAR